MTIQLLCPWCDEEVAFTIDDTVDELACSVCSTRIDFAPDPVTTYQLVYQAA